MLKFIISFSFVWLICIQAEAQILVEDATQDESAEESENTSPKKTGKGAAADYFIKREKKSTVTRQISSTDRVLMVHLGTFVNDKAYRWGNKRREEDVAGAQLGVTYRVGEWTNSMDLFFRAELMSFDIDSERPIKLSVMPIVAFPDARSSFPVYFGAGAGVGIFFEQAEDESDLSIDYALILGARFPELFESGGLFFETGLKGQIHLLSSGQHDGVFLAAGAIFNF